MNAETILTSTPLTKGSAAPKPRCCFHGSLRSAASRECCRHSSLLRARFIRFSCAVLIPRFGGHRLCDISRVEVQQYLLVKLRQGFAWETTNHLRHVANSRKVNDLRIKTSCLPEFHKWGLS